MTTYKKYKFSPLPSPVQIKNVQLCHKSPRIVNLTYLNCLCLTSCFFYTLYWPLKRKIQSRWFFFSTSYLFELSLSKVHISCIVIGKSVRWIRFHSRLIVSNGVHEVSHKLCIKRREEVLHTSLTCDQALLFRRARKYSNARVAVGKGETKAWLTADWPPSLALLFFRASPKKERLIAG